MLIRREATHPIDPALAFHFGDDVETMIDDLAQPFLDLAEKLEAIRLNDVDQASINAVLDANAFIWQFAANYMPRQLSKEVTPEMADLIVKIGDFMQQASRRLRDAKDDALLARLVELNLNMCDQVLSLRESLLGKAN